jgi:3-phenylpropionate/cinnamic acid dioxygenase small subunit
MNNLLKLNRLHRQIEYARFARDMANNNNQRQIMNNRIRALIRQTHPLEERIFVLSANMSPASVERMKRLRHVVAVQRTAKKTINKRRQNASMRASARRSLMVGAHHALTPAQISRFITPLRRRTGTVPKRVRTTRAVTALARHLNRK